MALRPLLVLALATTLGGAAGCIGLEDPSPPLAPSESPGAPAAPGPAPTQPPSGTLPPPAAATPPTPAPDDPAPTSPTSPSSPSAPSPSSPSPTAPSASPAPPTTTTPSGSSGSSDAPSPPPDVPDRPVRFQGGADAGPDRTSARVPTYSLAPDGSTLAAHVVAVREARLVIDSFLRVENLDVTSRMAEVTGDARNATGVTEARLELWRAGASLGTLDLLAPGASLLVTLAPGEVLEGRYSLAVGPTGGDGFEAALHLGVAP